MLLAVYLSAFGAQLWGANPYITAVLVAVVFGGVAGVWFLGRKAAGYLSGRFAGDMHLANMWECFLVMGVAAAALLYRFRLLLHMDAVARGNGLYDMAIIRAGEGVPAMAHRASYVYTVFLSLVLSFTGNKAVVGIVLQLFLEIAVILVLYAGVRLLTGRIEAVCVLTVMAFSMDFCGELFRLTPEVFYLLVYAGGILLLGVYAKKNTMGRLILAGIGIGWLGYLDPAGWILLLPGVYITLNSLLQLRKKACKCWMAPVVLVGLALAVMLILCVVDALLAGQSVGSILAEWFAAFVSGQGIVFPAGPDKQPVFSIVICFMAALAVFGFWFQEKQKQDIWILLLIVFTILDMLNVGALRYESFLTAIWGVLAGVGITSMRVVAVTEGERNAEGVQNKVVISCEENEQKQEADSCEDVTELPREKKIPLKELVVEEITLEDEPPKVKLIENPLPLPKKHVKKEMDFDHFVEDDDDYDI